jgi:hypothetical protein
MDVLALAVKLFFYHRMLLTACMRHFLCMLERINCWWLKHLPSLLGLLCFVLQILEVEKWLQMRGLIHDEQLKQGIEVRAH